MCGYPLLDMLRLSEIPGRAILGAGIRIGGRREPVPYFLAYSPYHHVEDGTKYPAVLFITGDSDTRVAPLHARKMAAEMQAAQGGDKPILLLYDTKLGHSEGRPRGKIIEEDTQVLSFLYWQLGSEVILKHRTCSIGVEILGGMDARDDSSGWDMQRALALLLAVSAGLWCGGARAQSGGEPIRLVVDATRRRRRFCTRTWKDPGEGRAADSCITRNGFRASTCRTGRSSNVAGMKFSGGRKNDSVAARSGGYVRVSSGRAGGSDIARRQISIFCFRAPPSGFSAGASATAQLDVLSWNQVLLYPKASPASDTYVRAESAGCRTGGNSGRRCRSRSRTATRSISQPVSLKTLVDSPVIAGPLLSRDST